MSNSSQATEPHQTTPSTDSASTPSADVLPLHLAGPHLTEKQLAARWHVHPGSLANARSAGRSPVPYSKPFGRVLYALVDVVKAEAATTVAA